MDAKKTAMVGLKAAGVMAGGNLLILGIMVALGYGDYPMDPAGVKMTGSVFTIAVLLTGGLIPGLAGSFIWCNIYGRWPDRAMAIFAVITLTVATLMTLPATNPNSPSGDAFILTSILHYSTALLGSWAIPYFFSAEKI